MYLSRSSTGLENRRSPVPSRASPIFFPRIDDNHCNRIHSSLTAVRFFDNGYVGKQPVGWNENFAEYWLREFQENIDRYTGDITEVLLKTALNTVQPINQSCVCVCLCVCVCVSVCVSVCLCLQ